MPRSMTNSMASTSGSDLTLNHQQPGAPFTTPHTFSTLVTPLDQYCLPSQSNLSPSSDSFKGGFEGLDDDYFLREYSTQKPLTAKRNLDDIQNGLSSFGTYSNPYQQQYQSLSNGNRPVSLASSTPPPVHRKLHNCSSRRSLTRTNSNLSYASSSNSASQLDRYLALTPLTTPQDPGSYQPSSQDFPFHSNAINPQSMLSTQSPLDSLAEDPQWDDDRSTEFYQDMTPAQSFTDATMKRTRAEERSDTISACWKSPLCPNQAARDGTPPNPTTCGGGCAPFLFGEEPLPNDINDAALDLPMVNVDQVTMVSRPHAQQQHQNQRQDQQQNQQQDPQPNKPKVQRVPKRADTDTKHESQGRTLFKATNVNIKKSSSPEATIARSTETTKKEARQPHNKVEQKYRDSISNQMEALRKVVPALSESARACIDQADIEDLPIPSKPSKAVILASATTFIRTQTKEKRQLETENAALRQRVLALQTVLGNKCDDCSLMQRAMGINLRAGPNMDQWPMSFQ
ncbi:hypothetical protein BLS_008107 [Venturia inaequalis]|uniref:BHLH domain-containing protein n=1 Tax=Venturia inaequalis TaxID=5025 RepID=A0A8H3YPB6_VENIN|nr:hypothetical protein BLS_008107 [Venturia inaequalis]